MDPAAVIAGLPPDTRPLPRVDKYDQLLGLRTGTDNTPASSPATDLDNIPAKGPRP